MRTSSSAEYMLRVAAEEIEHLEDQCLLQYPHIARFIGRPGPRFVLRHLQNFCWTAERAWGRIMARPVPAEAVQPQNIRPAPPVGQLQTALPHLWIDVTNTYRTGFGGGIGRVAMQLAKAGAETGLALPVVMEHGRIRPYYRTPGGTEELHFDSSVTYIIVDSFWEQLEEYSAVCETARMAGARVVTCIHDVIPLYHPSFNRRAFATRFAASFAAMIQQSDACITVSRYTEGQVRTYVDALGLRPDRPLPLTSFRLGADGHVGDRSKPVSKEVRALFARPNVFLSVGTIEPRKGYAITLDAFDRLWAHDAPCRFVIIGRAGWISKALERRILEHPLYGTRLHWLADVDDGDLAFAYRNAHCLIQASITEGFGLPVVEANHEGTPVIIADTDVFREFAGAAATYFRTCDSADLAAKIEEAVRRRPHARPFDMPTWKESLGQMADAIETALAAPLATRNEKAPRQRGKTAFYRRFGSSYRSATRNRFRTNHARAR